MISPLSISRVICPPADSRLPYVAPTLVKILTRVANSSHLASCEAEACVSPGALAATTDGAEVEAGQGRLLRASSGVIRPSFCQSPHLPATYPSQNLG
jgi:hypothetical protein